MIDEIWIDTRQHKVSQHVAFTSNLSFLRNAKGGLRHSLTLTAPSQLPVTPSRPLLRIDMISSFKFAYGMSHHTSGAAALIGREWLPWLGLGLDCFYRTSREVIVLIVRCGN